MWNEICLTSHMYLLQIFNFEETSFAGLAWGFFFLIIKRSFLHHNKQSKDYCCNLDTEFNS